MKLDRSVAQRPAARLNLAFGVAGTLLLAGLFWVTRSFALEIGEALTRNTVRLSLAWYAAALVAMLQLRPQDWTCTASRGQVARWCWTWGIACFLVHLAVALHYYDGWSHARAFERTRQASGIGEGLYVSYFFTWLWIADAAWWWTRPQSYAIRPVWIDRALHAFMIVIVFNGMVVFESGAIRWFGLLMFATLSAAWLTYRGLPRLRHA